MTPVEVAALRGRLLYALDATRPTEEPPASLYALVLGCCFLAAPDAEHEERLEELFYGRARLEQVDGDEILSALLLAGGAS